MNFYFHKFLLLLVQTCNKWVMILLSHLSLRMIKINKTSFYPYFISSTLHFFMLIQDSAPVSQRLFMENSVNILVVELVTNESYQILLVVQDSLDFSFISESYFCGIFWVDHFFSSFHYFEDLMPRFCGLNAFWWDVYLLLFLFAYLQNIFPQCLQDFVSLLLKQIEYDITRYILLLMMISLDVLKLILFLRILCH